MFRKSFGKKIPDHQDIQLYETETLQAHYIAPRRRPHTVQVQILITQ